LPSGPLASGSLRCCYRKLEIFDIPAIIAFLTQQLTLEPGDVIATGTPAGVALGMKPQVWLQPGDAIRMEIGGIGVLENSVVEH
jgi:2-keto-4-pentenoate hydratase/2-oxohepta-3-ene-1,7-dioic acid hydratase in catechol pathway